jgi:hypothetical protein
MVMKFDDLVKATNSTRLHKYVTLGDVAHELSLNKSTTRKAHHHNNLHD